KDGLRGYEERTRAAERMLAGALGAVAARRVIGAALSGGGRAPEDVVRMLDEASQAVQFNRQLLLTTLDNIDQGVAVVDEELRLVAWNRPYVEMFGLPHDFLHVGMPIANVYRYNVERGEIALVSERVESWVARRLEALSRRQHHFHEREGPDGRILRVIGEPLPGGAYVTSYTDITDLRRAARQLEEANEQLEARVTERTTQLKAAVEMAERATASKTRFLAAASHDLLQPLHAARLFIGALREDPNVAQSESQALAINADRSIESAHRLLTALLNLSKLESGGVEPNIGPLALDQLFTDIAREFTPIANAKGLELRVHPSRLWISTDRDLLRSMLQNLVANAIRYTDKGAVVVGARRKGGRADIVVVDTGRGIPKEARDKIFGEFVRLPGAPVDEPAAGLGLAIVQRLSHLLGHPLGFKSEVGHGTSFWISTPRTTAVMTPADTVATSRTPLFGKRVLCVDNETAITTALEALLKRWGAIPTVANSATEALSLKGPFDAALVDLHLGENEPDGLEIIRQLKRRKVRRIALITAANHERVGAEAAEVGAVLLPKPVKPAALKAFLNG
uniref:hybrid sensor histidine kinase/response regulator n=1 Tax=uncultured Brevundimonas sp. TaxID=213418 RepID=UPI0026200A34